MAQAPVDTHVEFSNTEIITIELPQDFHSHYNSDPIFAQSSRPLMEHGPNIA